VKVRGKIDLMRAQANGYFRRELRAASRLLRCIKSARPSSLRSSKFRGGSSITSGAAVVLSGNRKLCFLDLSYAS
jgi:hypothetical protein